MGLLEKIKNMFTEEVIEDDDVKVEKITKDVTKVSIDEPKEEKYETPAIEKFHFDDADDDENKTVFFDDTAFNDLALEDDKVFKEEKEEIKKEEKREVYQDKRNIEEIVEKKVFKPTPIISPVYGILDKNYHKEDIVSKTDNKKTNKKNEMSKEEITIDSIRDKAYGTLEDELENTLFGSNSILFKKEDEKKEDLSEKNDKDEIMSDLTDDISKELDEILIKKDNNKKIEKHRKKDTAEDDLLEFIDSTLYKDGDEEE